MKNCHLVLKNIDRNDCYLVGFYLLFFAFLRIFKFLNKMLKSFCPAAGVQTSVQQLAFPLWHGTVSAIPGPDIKPILIVIIFQQFFFVPVMGQKIIFVTAG